jgi:hypothetical protein
VGDFGREPRREPGGSPAWWQPSRQLGVTTDLQAFRLIVTAEPYCAVRQPRNVVILENVVREDTKGTCKATLT